MTDDLVAEAYYGSGWGKARRLRRANGNMKRFWFDALLVFLLVLGVASWISIAPVDLQSRIEHYMPPCSSSLRS